MGQNSLTLQPLLADTDYRIHVTPVYHHGDGPTTTQMERTRKTFRSFIHVQVSLRFLGFSILLIDNNQIFCHFNISHNQKIKQILEPSSV